MERPYHRASALEVAVRVYVDEYRKEIENLRVEIAQKRQQIAEYQQSHRGWVVFPAQE